MAAVKFGRFDAADYLKTEEDIATYLEAVMEDAGDDAALVSRALGTVARARNMSELARETGITREGLYKALSGEGNPSFATIVKVAHALGLKVRFEPVSASRNS
jgi:probable addiction module antidote protein